MTGELDGWTPGYLPSNGTDGDLFRAEWCDRCVRDHSAHIGGDCSTPNRWACGIFTRSLICYPDPGPDEWESRVVDGRYETRCTAFDACWPCRVDGATPPPARQIGRRGRRQRPGQQSIPLP